MVKRGWDLTKQKVENKTEPEYDIFGDKKKKSKNQSSSKSWFEL